MTRPSESSAKPPLPAPSEPPDTLLQLLPRLKKFRTVIAVAAGLVIIVVTGVVLYVNFRRDSDDEQIQRMVNDFAVAVSVEDQTRIASLLCQEEAAVFTDSDGYDPANNTGVATPKSQLPSTTTSDIHIVGDVASARVTRSAQYSTTLYFRKESSEWKVCAPAADQLSALSANTQHH